jgi:hypothetical protein
MFNCSEVSRLVSESLDRKLPLLLRMGLRMHFLMCRFCARYRKQLLIIRNTLHLQESRGEDTVTTVSLPQDARHRIKEALSRHSKSFG